MVETGADTNGVNSALDHVRDVSWAAGRTLRSKRVVLLAFAEVRRFLTDMQTRIEYPPKASACQGRRRKLFILAVMHKSVFSWGVLQAAFL